jgi:colicin import membrane protein
MDSKFSTMENHDQAYSLAFGLSLLGHLILATFLILNPDLSAKKTFESTVIDVSMVNLTDMASDTPSDPKTTEPVNEAPKPKAPEEKPVLPKPEPEPAPQPEAKKPPAKADISIAPKTIKKKTSLKKKTFKPSTVVKSAIKKIEKRVETERPDPVSQALERLKKQVKQEEKTGHAISDDEKSAQGTLPAGEGGVSGRKRAELIDIYHVEVAYQIQKEWAFPDQLAGEALDNLEARLYFKVFPDGEIRDITWETRSGNSYLDDSAYKAIIKANPVSPHPKGIIEPYVIFGVRFGPKGVK